MAEKFLMPKLSPTMEEGQISRWLKNEGDSFEANETLAEVDTDKATMEMTALNGGTLLKIIKKAGETAALGEPIAIIGEKGEDISALVAELEKSGSEAPSQTLAEQPVVETAKPLQSQVFEPAAAVVQTANGSGSRLLVSPIAARMAAENGIDLKTIKGTGPNGRIIKRDIEALLKTAVATTAAAPRQAFSATIGPAPYRDEPVSKMRKVIATRLAESIGPIPTFYLTAEIETDNLLAARKQINEHLSEEEKISVNDFIVKAAAIALGKHPWVNSSYRDGFIRFFEQADIGVAVAIDEGLITPVVRGADRKGLAEISSEIKSLASRARERKLQPDEYTGATFSISNLGMMGIKEFTAIINPPEAAILAVGSSQPQPVVRNGEIVIRNIMNVTMSCDHRVVDGATGARFLQTLRQLLENPALMLL
ncbi:MAG: pyruvate dehydrogenase complex dihydrolipoamide acetyltransferase [Pyrinomonadaceae bacterium]|jgi:pyruvate dehydrogenase E2 component (dihydrolipoamide acetyltransferase)